MGIICSVIIEMKNDTIKFLFPRVQTVDVPQFITCLLILYPIKGYIPIEVSFRSLKRTEGTYERASTFLDQSFM